ncbi:hypothetical protein N182_35765 [Sinorhizobium sp. GL2]|nr:hypothetical protein N182_35765 [Sinorhizobium sp. GL2]
MGDHHAVLGRQAVVNFAPQAKMGISDSRLSNAAPTFRGFRDIWLGRDLTCVGLNPFEPVYKTVVRDDFHSFGKHTIAEKDDVHAIPSCAWNDEAVEFKKMRGFGNILRPRVFVTCSVIGQLPIAGSVKAKTLQCVEVHELKRAIDRYFQLMHSILHLRWKYGLPAAQMEMHLRYRSVALL